MLVIDEKNEGSLLVVFIPKNELVFDGNRVGSDDKLRILELEEGVEFILKSLPFIPNLKRKLIPCPNTKTGGKALSGESVRVDEFSV
jgi:hypothetical protein